MTVRMRITFLVLTFAYIASIGECADKDVFNCFQCEDDKTCSYPVEKGLYGTVSCSKKNGVCFTRKTDKLTIRGCQKSDDKVDESKGKVLFNKTCNTDKCNGDELYECYACSKDKNCKDPMKVDKVDKEYCLSSFKGCYTIRTKQDTFRGCAEDDESLKKVVSGGELQGPCKTNLCNAEGRPKDAFACFYCKDKGTCNEPKEGETGTRICKSSRSCYTRKLAQFTERGCVEENAAQEIVDDLDSLLGKPCKENLCNKEKTYNCYKCTGKEDCTLFEKMEKIEQEVCADRDEGCFTIRKYDGNTIRGCATKETNLTHLAEAGILKEQCKQNLCNSFKTPNGTYTCNKCDDQKTCDKLDDKTPFDKEFCEGSNEGCFTLVTNTSTSRGCVQTKETLEQLKGNGTLLLPCKNSGCNNQTIYECHQCEGVGQCLYPNVTAEAKFEKCIAGSDLGCVTLAEKNKITRTCAKNQTQVDEFQKRGNCTKPCTEDRCNREQAKLNSGSGTISPLFVSVILPVIGVLFVRL